MRTWRTGTRLPIGWERYLHPTVPLSFDIIEVNTLGESRISFNLKNSLKDTSLDKNRRIKLNLNTKKIKEIKEKNIKNEITKYLIILNTKVEYELVGENKSGEFSVSKKGNFNLTIELPESDYFKIEINSILNAYNFPEIKFDINSALIY